MLGNFVKQAVSSGGTGNLTLGSADTGYSTLDTVVGQNVFVPYTIEDGDRETGIGYLSDATTFVRSTIHDTLVSGTYDNTAPTAINVTTAAKLMITASASGTFCHPNASAGLGDAAGINLCPAAGAWDQGLSLAASGTAMFIPVIWFASKTITRLGVRLQVVAGSAGASSCTAALFHVGTDGKPGRRICSFGDLGDMRTTAAGTIMQTPALSPAVFLPPGVYYLGLLPTYTGTAPQIRSTAGAGMIQSTGLVGSTSGQQYLWGTVSAGNLNDPPTTTGFAGAGQGGGIFWLALL